MRHRLQAQINWVAHGWPMRQRPASHLLRACDDDPESQPDPAHWTWVNKYLNLTNDAWGWKDGSWTFLGQKWLTRWLWVNLMSSNKMIVDEVQLKDVFFKNKKKERGCDGRNTKWCEERQKSLDEQKERERKGKKWKKEQETCNVGTLMVVQGEGHG